MHFSPSDCSNHMNDDIKTFHLPEHSRPVPKSLPRGNNFLFPFGRLGQMAFPKYITWQQTCPGLDNYSFSHRAAFEATCELPSWYWIFELRVAFNCSRLRLDPSSPFLYSPRVPSHHAAHLSTRRFHFLFPSCLACSSTGHMAPPAALHWP
jgi:hypothetical protein